MKCTAEIKISETTSFIEFLGANYPKITKLEFDFSQKENNLITAEVPEEYKWDEILNYFEESQNNPF